MPRKKIEIPTSPHAGGVYVPTARKIIKSTLAVLGSQGHDGLTTKTISKKSNLSTGIIHHYFDTKEKLIYASYVFMIRNLQRKTIKVIKKESDPYKRLWKMVKVHFGDVQLSSEATSIWPQFWAHAIHDKAVARLYRVYSRRLRSNFTRAFREIGFDRQQSIRRAEQLLCAIHGVWIESRISKMVSSKEQLRSLLWSYIQLLTGIAPATKEVIK